jgi:Flp pilus assembly pilin Flp
LRLIDYRTRVDELFPLSPVRVACYSVSKLFAARVATFLAFVKLFRRWTYAGDLAMASFRSATRTFIRAEGGATFMEYALVLLVISLVAGAGALLLGEAVSAVFSGTGNGVSAIPVTIGS